MSSTTDAQSQGQKKLVLSNVSLSYGNVKVLDDVSLSVDQQETHAIVGPNGAGKTSLFGVMSGTVSPSAGSKVVHDGKDISNASPYTRTKQGLVRSYQISSVFPGLTAVENVAVAVRAAAGMSGGLSPLNADVRAGGASRQILERVGLGHSAFLKADELAHGDLRLLEIAVCLGADPDTLLLDEPTAGMSAGETSEVVALISGLRDEGMTIVIVEHDMDLIFAIADRVTVLDRGRVILTGTPTEVGASEEVQRVYLGTADDAAATPSEVNNV